MTINLSDKELEGVVYLMQFGRFVNGEWEVLGHRFFHKIHGETFTGQQLAGSLAPRLWSGIRDTSEERRLVFDGDVVDGTYRHQGRDIVFEGTVKFIRGCFEIYDTSQYHPFWSQRPALTVTGIDREYIEGRGKWRKCGQCSGFGECSPSISGTVEAADKACTAFIPKLPAPPIEEAIVDIFKDVPAEAWDGVCSQRDTCLDLRRFCGKCEKAERVEQWHNLPARVCEEQP